MKKIKTLFRNPLTWIFLLALIIRIYKLDLFPYGFQFDEVKVGWNALSILKTAKDDHGTLLPLYYNTFGDWRPTGIFYLTIPSIVAFGRNIFAVRFPGALMGALTIFPLYLLTVIVVSKERLKIWKLNTGHIASILLALSPWHIEVSRATSEVGMSMFFTLFAIYYFIKLIKTKAPRYAVFSIISILVASLLYHSIRVLAPLLYLATLYFYFKEVRRSRIRKIVYLCLAVVATLSIYFAASSEGRQRFNQVSIFNDANIVYETKRIKGENLKNTIFSKLFDNKVVIYTKHFALEYSKYFSGDFLIGYGAKPYRYRTPGTGLLNYVEIIFLVFGLLEIAKGKKPYLPVILLLISPVAAALTFEDSPNLHRALLMLPFLLTIESFGVYRIINLKRKYAKKLARIVTLAVILSTSFFLYMFFHHSFDHKPFIEKLIVDSPTYRDVGTIEMARQLDGLKANYDKIIVTNFPSSPYSWYAFFTNQEPGKINTTSFIANTNERVWQNIIFSQQKCPSDDAFSKYKDKRMLVIDSGECPYESKIKDNLPAHVTNKSVRPDGTEIYVFLERN